MYMFSNILGVFVFDEEFKVIDSILFNSLEQYKNKEEYLEKIKNKHEDLKEPDNNALTRILLYFKNDEFFNDFYNKNLQLTKYDVKNSVHTDTLIVQSIKSINELDRAINLLVKRLREWYELHNPEFSVAMQSHEKFVEEIINKEKKDLLKELKVDAGDSFGADLRKEHLEPIKSLALQIHSLYQLRNSQESYISVLMDESCPNLKAVCGVLVGAKIMEQAGSLKRLSEMPASTIQILGAEKALFRHMKTGAKPPRHGFIVNHPLIAKAPDNMHGKIARALADKICIAAKVDFFKGEFIGDKLRDKLDKKFAKRRNSIGIPG